MKKKQNNIFLKNNDTQTNHNRRESVKAVSQTNRIIKDHHEKRLNVNRTTSTYSNIMGNKKKNIVLFIDSILKTLYVGEINHYIDGGKVRLKSFFFSIKI